MDYVASVTFLLRGEYGREEVCLSLNKKLDVLNGYGGKLESGETIEERALLEVWQESGSRVESEDMQFRAFVTTHKPNEKWELYIYTARKWDPDPQDSAEHGPPAWYNVRTMPFDQMFPDCRYWLEGVLLTELPLNIDVFFGSDARVRRVQFQEFVSDTRPA